MYKRILVPVAISHDDKGEKAIAVANLLADEGAKITLLNVMEAIPGYAENYIPKGVRAENREAAEEALKALSEKVTGGAKVVVLGGHPGRAILDHAAAEDTDCIVIASHKPGLEDYFLGSTAARVVRHAQCAVHVIR